VKREADPRPGPPYIDPDGAQPHGEGMTIGIRESGRTTIRTHATSLPNFLTYGRIAAAPLVGATFFIQGDVGHWLAFLVFVTASVTDYVDGYIARAWQQQSALGRMLDPIADKLLVAVSILVLVANGMLAGYSIWAAIIVLMREIFVSGLREFLAELRVSVPVTRLAKWKTTLQLIAIATLLVAPALQGNQTGFVPLMGLAMFWIAALVTLYTGFDYFRAGLKHLVEEEA
jgi:cardiolipin synthase